LSDCTRLLDRLLPNPRVTPASALEKKHGGGEKARIQIQTDLESSSAHVVDFVTVVQAVVISVSCALSCLTILVFSLCKERWILLVYKQPSSVVNSF
jgi:hypothetical protein